MKPAVLLTLMAAALFVTGCPPAPEPETMLYPTTGPPPSRTATLVNEEEFTITISRGVAMGVACYSYCTEQDDGDPCEGATLTADHPEVIATAATYRFGGQPGHFVLSGQQAGTSRVTLQTACGSRTYKVRVLSPAP